MSDPFAVDPVALSLSADAADSLGMDVTDGSGPVRTAVTTTQDAATGLYGWSTGGGMAGVVDRWGIKLDGFTKQVRGFADATRGAVILVQTTDDVNADGIGG